MEIEKKNGFSVMGLLFGAHYYAGYGKTPKAFILAAISGFPLFAIGVWIYCGVKANSELPVNEAEFKWPLVGASVGIQLVVAFILKTVIGAS